MKIILPWATVCAIGFAVCLQNEWEIAAVIFMSSGIGALAALKTA